MARRKRTSMYDQYRDDIVAALDAGKTIIQIYNEIIYPAMNGACEYSGLAYYVNKNGLRYVTENDGYEPVHICAECEHCGKIQRERFDPMSFCKKAEREILPVVKTSPRWCPLRSRNMSKSRASKLNGYRSAISRQKNDVYKFKPKRGKKK